MINWIYAGLINSQEQLEIFRIPKQVCAQFTQEQCVLWCVTNDVSFDHINRFFLLPESSTNLIIQRIDPAGFVRLVTPFWEIVRTFENFEDFKEDFELKGPQDLAGLFECITYTCHRIKANNLIKEILLPLILATQSKAGHDCHYLDLNVNVNFDRFTTAIGAQNSTDPAGPLAQRLGSDIKYGATPNLLPKWNHLKLTAIIPEHSTFIPNDPSQLTHDVWWMYIPANDPGAINYFLSVFFQILFNFFEKFPKYSCPINLTPHDITTLKNMRFLIENKNVLLHFVSNDKNKAFAVQNLNILQSCLSDFTKRVPILVDIFFYCYHSKEDNSKLLDYAQQIGINVFDLVTLWYSPSLEIYLSIDFTARKIATGSWKSVPEFDQSLFTSEELGLIQFLREKSRM